MQIQKIEEEDKFQGIEDQNQDKDNDDDDEGTSEDEKKLEENAQQYFELDETELRKKSYKSMIEEVNNKMQIKKDTGFRLGTILKKLVSRQKRRYTQDGFDLDLTYVTPNLIAMGYPSNKLERAYRNSMAEVQRFFKTKHPEHYKVYNLCSERSYPVNSFEKVCDTFTFEDHNPPPFKIIYPFCMDVHNYLNENSLNVAAIHCKAGKGRTGLMICAYLLFSKMFDQASDSLVYYGMSRTKNSKVYEIFILIY